MPIVDAGTPLDLAVNQPHFTATPKLIVSFEGEMVTDLSDRLRQLDIAASLDNACSTGAFTFARSRGADSLSPLIAASGFRFGDDGRSVIDPNISLVLNLEINGNPAGTIWEGRIDRVNVAAGEGLVGIQCRDRGAVFLNRTIHQAARYGSDAGIDLEDVMGALLTDNGFGPSSLTLPGGSPGFAVTNWPQEEMSVMEALRQMAQQIGWDVRWRPGEPSALVLYDPGRARTVPDNIIGPTRYTRISELSWGDEDVRNNWDLYWQDADGVVHGPVNAQDLDSITRYGERYARIYIQRATLIRSDASATNFVNAALADTKDPFASHRIEMPLYPFVVLNDLHQYQPNGDEYDAAQTFAVVGYTHHWHARQPGESAESAMPLTTIMARGKPLAAYREYRRSVAPRVIVSTSPPDDAIYAPEGTITMVTDSLAFPA